MWYLDLVEVNQDAACHSCSALSVVLRGRKHCEHSIGRKERVGGGEWGSSERLCMVCGRSSVPLLRPYLAPLDRDTPCACASCALMMYDSSLFSKKWSIAAAPKLRVYALRNGWYVVLC